MQSDDDHFEALTAAVFCARFNPDVVQSRWAAIRRGFAGFALEVVASWPEGRTEQVMREPGMIRNRKKIAATIRNAAELSRLVRRHGSVQAYLEPAKRSRAGAPRAIDRWAHYIGLPSILCYPRCVAKRPHGRNPPSRISPSFRDRKPARRV
ncbi:MAG TPA: DNA-3-methyladenine glycosylase I [Nitrospira sp.]|nr:DNA-3-methyladenine glycosylase I [Nitrospira sp.]